MNEVDPNAIAVGVTTDLVKDFFKAVLESGSGAYSRALERNFPKFEAHMVEIHRRVSKVKLLCAPDAPTDFRNVYVCPFLTHNKKTVDDSGFLAEIRKNSRIVVQSQGGAGKSFLMRDIWLSIFDNPLGKIPILVELRGLNDPSQIDLKTYIRATVTKSGLTDSSFGHFCDAGAFTFLFDGFDEVEKGRRSDLERQILALEQEYPSCGIVVTGRPDERFSSWSQFRTFSCCQFSYEQFRELIQKVPFDDTSKKKFLKVADEDFFANHEDFLSNPLLALMMLMTYKENADIPSRLSVFYENCYFALFARHDALKEQFNRPKIMDQNEFRRVFSLFSYFSYLKNKPDFTEDELDKYVSIAVEHAGFRHSLSEVKNEFLETVNLLYKDGLKYWFVHRSFQEYFAAYCVTNILTDRVPESLELFAERRMDSTLVLAYEMHQDLVAKHYLLPRYEENRNLLETAQQQQTTRNYSALKNLNFRLQGKVGVSGSPFSSVSFHIQRDIDLFMNAVLDVYDDADINAAIDEAQDGYMSFVSCIQNASKDLLEVFDDDAAYTVSLSFDKTQPKVTVESSSEVSRKNSEAAEHLKKLVINSAPKAGRGFEKYYRSRLDQVLKFLFELKNAETDKAARLAKDFGLS